MLDLVTAKFAQANASRPAEIDLSSVVPDFGTSYGYSSAIGAAKYLTQIKGTAWSALRLRSDKIAQLQWKCFRQTAQSEHKELELTHWLVNLVHNPNRFKTRFEIWSLIDQWLTVTGNAFVLILRDQHGDPAEMWPLDSNRVSVIPARPESGELVAGYYYYAPTKTHVFGADDVMHVRLPIISDNFLSNLFYGVAEFGRFSDVIDTEMSTLLYQSRYFNNNAMPNFVIERTEVGAINSQNIDLMRQQWEQNRAGAQNAGKFAILPYGFTFKPVIGKAEIDYLGTMQAIKSRICEAMGVPPTMLTSEFNNRAAADTTVDMFLSNCILPRATLIKQTFTSFFRKIEADVIVDHEPISHEDPDIVIRKIEALNKLGGAAINEIRNELFGWGKLKGGDDPLVPNNLVTLQSVISGATLPQKPGAPPTGNAPAEESPEESKAIAKDWGGEPEEKVYVVWKAKDTLVAKHRPRLKKVIAATFAELEASVLPRVNGLKNVILYARKDGDGDAVTEEDARKLRSAVEFDVEEWGDKIAENATPELGALIKAAIADALADVDWSGTFSSEDAVRRKVIESVMEKVSEPLKGIALDLSEIVSKGLSEGNDVDAISEALRQRFEWMKESQADNIAQTTSTATMNEAQTRTWREAKVKGKRQWLTQRDGDVRPAHIRADGQVEDADGMFTIGGHMTPYPAGTGLPASQACNCRCYVRIAKTS